MNDTRKRVIGGRFGWREWLGPKPAQASDTIVAVDMLADK
jgi:hypothetical protein